MRARLNLLISGGTGSGKTTTLNALSRFIAAGERIVTIEDAAELRLQQPHVVRLEARPPNLEGRGEVTIRALVRNALRMRPDRIVVGEVRGAEALDMLSAMTSGHDGSLSTVHAGSPEEALRRVETLALMADVALPHAAVREQVAGALDLVVHQARGRDGARRLVAVAEVVRVAGGAGVRELYALRDGRPCWRAALGDRLAGAAGGGRVSPRRPLARRRPRVLRCLAAWDALAAVEGCAPCPPRPAALLAPLARARPRGARADRPRAPPARPCWGRVRCWPAAGCWPGRSPGVVLATAGPWVALALARARRRRYRAELGAGAPVVARALADALAGGHSIRGAIAAAAARRRPDRGRRRRAARRGGGAGARRADRRGARARLRTRRRAGPRARGFDTIVAAILLQREAGGDLARLLRGSPGRSRTRCGWSRTRAPRPPRPASPACWSPRSRWAPAALAELASPGYLAGWWRRRSAPGWPAARPPCQLGGLWRSSGWRGCGG